MNLNDIRKNIDRIDSQIIELIKERMDCSKYVAEYKRENGMPVFDAAREQRILESLSVRGGEYSTAMKAIYETVMEQSKALQYPYVKSEQLRTFEPLKPHGEVKKIACQGVKGAYGAITGASLYPNAEILYCHTFSDVCKAVHDGKAEYGILPVENSWAGSVHEVYDLLINGKFLIAESVDAHIKHNLIGTEDAEISDITEIGSHPQALRQCADFISEHGFVPSEYGNTAVAVKAVAERKDKFFAAIGSKDAAAEYGLKVLKSNIASSASNTTRFVSISEDAQRSTDADKITMIFSIKHESGSLCKALTHFASGGMNLTKIESRPIKNRDFEYMFYVDVVGSLSDPKTAGVLATMASELPDLILLGNYRESRIDID